MGGSVIFQCWLGRRWLTELLSDSSSSLSGLLRSCPPGMRGMDDKQRSQGIPHWETAWRLLSFCLGVDTNTSLCLDLCIWLACCLCLVLNKHIKWKELCWNYSRRSSTVVCYSYKEKPAVFDWGWWKMNPCTLPTPPSRSRRSRPPRPVGQAHKLDLLLELTHFNTGSLERDSASTISSLFLLLLQWTQLMGWLWFDI